MANCVEIDDLVDFGSKSIKDVRTRRIYNEEPSMNGLLLESIESTLTMNSDANFLTSVTGNINVGATGFYEADIEQHWGVTAGTSACIYTNSGFCVDSDHFIMDLDTFGEINAGTSFCIKVPDFCIKDTNGDVCFEIDTSSCSVTVAGTLIANNIVGGGITGDLDIYGSLIVQSVTGSDCLVVGISDCSVGISGHLQVYDDFTVQGPTGNDCFTIDVTDCSTTINGPLTSTNTTTLNDTLDVLGNVGITGTVEISNNFTVQGPTGIDCLVVNPIDCTTVITSGSTQAFLVEDSLGNDCFVIDVNNCAVTVYGTLTAQNLTSGEGGLGVSGDLGISGDLTVCNGIIYIEDGSVTNPSIAFCDDQDTGLYSSGDNVIAFSNNGNTTLTMTGTNNIGIGTATPESLLHVYDGDLIVTNTSVNALVIEREDGNECFVVDTTNCSVGISGDLNLYSSIIVQGPTGVDCLVINPVECTTTITSGSTQAFIVEDLSGNDCFVIDTTSCSIGISGPTTLTSNSATAFTIGDGVTECFSVDTTDCTVTVNGTLYSNVLGISGDLTVEGNLTVKGTETILNTETIEVDDNAIVLNGITSPSNTTADDGGIILKGDSDYTILWDKDCAGGSWSFNQNVNVSSTLGYYIDCKLHHSENNLVVNTRASGNAGAIYLSTNDYATPVLGDWRMKTQTNIHGFQALVFQYYDGSTWKTKQRIEHC